MYCSKCGNQLTDGEKVCPKCGFSLEEEEKLVETVSHAPIQYQPSGQEYIPSKYEYYVTPQTPGKNKKATAAFVLGILGVIAWIVPLIGFPVTIAGLVLGIQGIKSEQGKRNTKAITGVVLSVIFLVATTANSAIGAYQGFHGTAWFQKGQTKTDTASVIGKDTFMIQDASGNILLTGGVEKAEVTVDEDFYGQKSYYVEITFDDYASDKIQSITKKYFGEELYIYVENELVSTPTVTEVITGGGCLIGADSYEEAEHIVMLLNSEEL